MNMGGRSEATSECKSVTNSTRNSISQDDKGSELKGRKQAGRSASSDKKSENAEPSKLTYTSEEDVYYEPGGKRELRRNLSNFKSRSMSKTIWIVCAIRIITCN